MEIVAVVWGIVVGWNAWWLAWDIWHAWCKKRKDNGGGGTLSVD